MITAKDLADRLNVLCENDVARRTIAALLSLHFIEEPLPKAEPFIVCQVPPGSNYRVGLLGIINQLHEEDGAQIRARYTDPCGKPFFFSGFDVVDEPRDNGGFQITWAEVLRRMDATIKK